MRFVNDARGIGAGRTPLKNQHVGANHALARVLQGDIERRRVLLERLTESPNDETRTTDRSPGDEGSIERRPVHTAGSTEPNIDEGRRLIHPPSLLNKFSVSHR